MQGMPNRIVNRGRGDSGKDQKNIWELARGVSDWSARGRGKEKKKDKYMIR